MADLLGMIGQQYQQQDPYKAYNQALGQKRLNDLRSVASQQFSSGQPDRGVLLSGLANVNPMQAMKMSGEFGANGLNESQLWRMERQKEIDARAMQADEFYNSNILPLIGDEITGDEVQKINALYAQYAGMGGKLKNPSESYTKGLKEQSMADKRALGMEKTAQSIEQQKVLFAQKVKDWEDAQSQKIPKRLEGQWKTVRADYRKDMAGYKESTESVSKVERMIQMATSAGDIAAIFSFMKALDPGSVVRESEYEVAAGAGGVFDKAFNTVKKAKGEGVLGDGARKQILEAVRYLGQEYKRQSGLVDAHYGNMSTKLGLDPTTVLYPSGLFETTVPKFPKKAL